MKLGDIIGQEEIKTMLTRSYREDHLPHALLFSGIPGSANMALAWALASYILCQNASEFDSCGACPACSKSAKMIHPDLHFFFPTTTNDKVKKSNEAVSSSFMADWRGLMTESPYFTLQDWTQILKSANKQPSISKEESRHMAKTVSLRPFEGQKKVLIVWLPELMHPSAANAILKILEEPPSDTVYILVAEQTEMILPTILSRVQRIQIPDFTSKEIIQYLALHHQIEAEDASQVAFLSEGSISEAKRLMHRTDKQGAAFFKEWMRGCFKKDLATIMGLADEFSRFGREEQKGVIKYSLTIFREALLANFNTDLLRLSDQELVFIQKFAKFFSTNSIEKLYHSFSTSHYHLERNANPKIVFTSISIEVMQSFGSA